MEEAIIIRLTDRHYASVYEKINGDLENDRYPEYYTGILEKQGLRKLILDWKDLVEDTFHIVKQIDREPSSTEFKFQRIHPYSSNVAFFKSLNCINLQIDLDIIKDLYGDIPIEGDKMKAYRTLRNLQTRIATHIVTEMPEYLNAPWDIY